MGDVWDHRDKAEHIRDDIKRHLAIMEKGEVVPKPFIDDVFFCASAYLDQYLSFWHIHPFNRFHREELFQAMAAGLMSPVPFADYRSIAWVMDDVVAGKTYNTQQIQNLVYGRLDALRGWINYLSLPVPWRG